MDRSRNPTEDAHSVSENIRGQLVEPFVEAVRTALGEMAGIQVELRTVSQGMPQHGPVDLAAVVSLTSANLRTLIFRYPLHVAEALARRILPESTNVVDDNLIRDCLGEIANVVAGQAKALLAGTLYQFGFSLPRVVSGADEPLTTHHNCLALDFSSPCGDFELALYLKREA